MTATDTQTAVPAVIGVVEEQGRFLLVRRCRAPNAGCWGFPGGKIEFGETWQYAAAREVLEETGIIAAPSHVIDALDVIDPASPPAYHFILLAVTMRYLSGNVTAADDVDEAGWFAPNSLPHPCVPEVNRLISLGAISR